MGGDVAVLFLEVAGRSFAVEVGQVETLRRKETLYPVQEGPPALSGFLPWVDGALPVVDLGICLGLSARALLSSRLLVVSALEEAPLAFQVEQVQGPVAADRGDLALLPDLLRQLQARQVVWGLVRRRDELVPLLDLGQVVAPDEVAILLDLAQAVIRR